MSRRTTTARSDDVAATATRVVVSYPPDLGESAADFFEREAFRSYLARAWDDVEAGAVIEEVVNLGCCTDAMQVPLTVESVEGGTRLDAETTVEFVEGDEPAGLDCGW